MKTGGFKELSDVLYGGKVVAADFKTMPGTRSDLSMDELANSLLNSLVRSGIVVSGELVNKNK